MRNIIVGWDGGGTGTTAACISMDGQELAREHFGTLNLNGAESAKIERTVAEATCWMRTIGECKALCVGAAGVSNPAASKRIVEMLRSNGFSGRLTLKGDHETALRGAVGTEGAVLISGTGSICFGRTRDGRESRTGGGGYLIDDEGSGYAIGRDILSAVLCAMDGRTGPTRLSEGVERTLGTLTRERLIRYVYRESQGKADIACFAPLLAPAVEDGDKAAVEIAARAANKLYILLEAVNCRLGLPVMDVALMGSVLTRCEPVRERVLAHIRQNLPGVSVVTPHGDAAWGAAQIAKEEWEGNNHA